MRFEDMDLSQEVVQAAAAAGWTTPTPLQEKAVPALLSGRDAAIRQTNGTGKTATYLLPAIDRVVKVPGDGLRVLVLVPDESGAQRITGHLKNLCAPLDLKFCQLAPGEPPTKDAGVGVVTPPGLPESASAFGALEYLIIDGADKWLKSGDRQSVEKFFAAAPSACRRIILSEYLKEEVLELEGALLREPSIFPTAEGSQAIYPVDSSIKQQLLIKLVQDGTVGPSLIIARSRNRADRVFSALNKIGRSPQRIQGHAGRNQREKWVSALSSGKAGFLVAAETDGPAYSLLRLPSVFYYDAPGFPPAYFGRFQGAFYGAEGTSFILASPQEEERVTSLERLFGSPIEKRILEDFDYTPKLPEEEQRAEHPARNDGTEAAERRSKGRRDQRKKRQKGEGREGRKEHQKGKPPEEGPGQERTPAPQSAPDSEIDADGQEAMLQRSEQGKPLFPGQRSLRWNAFRLSLARPDSQEAPQQQAGGGRSQAKEAQQQAQGKPGRKSKRAARPKDRRGSGARQEQAPKTQEASEEGAERQPVTSVGQRQKPDVMDAKARRFNSSARYSSLAGAPPPPPEEDRS